MQRHPTYTNTPDAPARRTADRLTRLARKRVKRVKLARRANRGQRRTGGTR